MNIDKIESKIVEIEKVDSSRSNKSNKNNKNKNGIELELVLRLGVLEIIVLAIVTIYLRLW